MAKSQRRGRSLADRLSFGISLVTVAAVAIFLGWLMGQYAIQWVTAPLGSRGTVSRNDVQRFEEVLERRQDAPVGPSTAGSPAPVPSSGSAPVEEPSRAGGAALKAEAPERPAVSEAPAQAVREVPVAPRVPAAPSQPEPVAEAPAPPREAPAAVSPAAPSSGESGETPRIYRVQVGAFRQREGAQRMVEALGDAGYEAIIVPAGDFYR